MPTGPSSVADFTGAAPKKKPVVATEGPGMIPPAAPAPLTPPKPNVDPVSGPPVNLGPFAGVDMSGVTKAPKIATEGPGMTAPPPLSPVPGDTRGTVIKAPVSQLQQQATGTQSSALTGLNQAVNAVPAFKPVPGPDFGGANSSLGAATSAISGANLPKQDAIASTDPSATQSALQAALRQSGSPDAARARELGMSGLESLSSGPNRADLAAQALQLERERTNPSWQNDLRLAGQKAAALGRIGSGMTTTELGDLTLQREKALGQFGEDAALKAADQEMSDRLAKFNAASGYSSNLTGQDLAKAGFASDTALKDYGVQNTSREQGVTERNFQSDQDRAAAALDLSKGGALAGIGGQQAGMATATSGAAASERDAAQQAAVTRAALQQSLLNSAGAVQGQQFDQGQQTAGLATQQQGFQNTLQQQAQQAEVERQQLQEQLLNGAFTRQLEGSQAEAGLGYGNDPYSLQLQGSNATQGQASDQQAQLAALMQQLALQKYLPQTAGAA